MDIDWNNAPDWATHAVVKLHNPNLGSVHWSCLIDGEHRVNPDGLWFHPDGYRVAEQRPKKLTEKAWVGSSLPPVGTVCELKTIGAATFGVAEIMYSSESALVWRWKGLSDEFGSEWDNVQFRPIRTPEQIAAAEKGRAVTDMLGIVTSPKLKGRGVASQLEALYDYGYRKLEPGEEC